MLTPGISLINFKKKSNLLIVKKKLSKILKKRNQVLESLSTNYKDSYNRERIRNYKKFLNFRLIGMGGSSLGAQAIYDFLKNKIKKKFIFIDNLQNKKKEKQKKKFCKPCNFKIWIND